MPELTDRGKAFRAAIAGFIEARREAKLKGKEDAAGSPSKYDYATWLEDAANRAHNLRVVTHPIKFTHSAIKGASSIHAGATKHTGHDVVGTHCLAAPLEDFAITDAKHLDVYSLLKEIVEGKRLLEWLRDNDPDLASALSDDPSKAKSLMIALQQVFKSDDKLVSNTLAKQVYWLADDKDPDPCDNEKFHLLQPMFSSSLEHVVNEEVQASRETFFAARGTSKQKPSHAEHSTYPGLVARTLGGSNAQNVSPQNKVRSGVNYLLPSLPPPAWQRNERTNVTKHDSAFDVFLWFGNVRELVDTLRTFLRANPDRVEETRDHRKTIEQAIGQELALFGVAVRAEYPAGWTRTDDRDRPRCEQLWLDPDRVELPNRSDPAHPEWTEDDAAFRRDYEFGHWPDEVATRFGNWLNAQLRKADELVSMAEPERNHWARQAILEVAWPIPLQRRAEGGGT